MQYLSKMRGGDATPQRMLFSEIMWTGLGIFISFMCLFHVEPLFKNCGYPLLFAPIGASAILVFSLPDSPYSQPRSVIGGHFVSAFAGISALYLFGNDPALAASFAVASAGMLMCVTKTIHPPGGATALLSILGYEGIDHLGYFFILTPCVSCAVILCILGILINNLSPRRRYPRFWW